MSSHRRLASAALGLAAALLWPRLGAAQLPALTFEEALARARQRAPAVVEAQGRVAEAQGPVAGAAPFLRANPVLEAEVGPRTRVDGARGIDVAVGLTQPLELAGQQGARRDAARAGLSAEQQRQRDTERRVVGEAAEAFLRALHAQERLGLARQAEEAARETASSTQRRLDAGDVPRVDVNVARVALARARADVADAEGDAEATLGALRLVLGLGPEVPLEPKGELRALASRPVNAPSEARARPDLAALEAEVTRAEAELRLGRGEAWPDLGVGVRYQREADETAVLGTLSVPLPLFARGQETRVTAEARVQRMSSALEAARRSREVSLASARALDRKRQEAVVLLEQEALPLLDENAALARRAYEVGEMGLAEFLLVRRDTRDTRAAWLDALLLAALARVQLAVEMGVLP
ncbi:TolC family protein [Myxococcaceae bacterium JPH2]|nr:TolC family protein [Myxococcaceae bacterium JPH2]